MTHTAAPADISSSSIDRNAVADRETPLWGETRWLCGWSPDNGVGIYIHAGRYRHDIDFWWVHLAVYLPDGKLAVDRFWCRNEAVAGLVSDTLRFEMTQGGWTSTYDGVCQWTDREALTRNARGCSAPSVRAEWKLSAAELAPEWDMFEGASHGQDFATALHVQGTFSVTGRVRVGDQEYEFNGVGFKDHSAGARNMGAWTNHRFLIGVLPDLRTVHAVTIIRDGAEPATVGRWHKEGVVESLTGFEAPLMTTLVGEPDDQEIVLRSESETLAIRTEIIHALPITISQDNDNFNGIDWEMDDDPMVMVESIVRFTAPDGDVGYGFFERSARRSSLPRP